MVTTWTRKPKFSRTRPQVQRHASAYISGFRSRSPLRDDLNIAASHQSDVERTHTGAQAIQILVCVGYRSEAVIARVTQAYPDTELVIAMGRKGKTRVASKTQTASRAQWPWRPSSKPSKARRTTESAHELPGHPFEFVQNFPPLQTPSAWRPQFRSATPRELRPHDHEQLQPTE